MASSGDATGPRKPLVLFFRETSAMVQTFSASNRTNRPLDLHAALHRPLTSALKYHSAISRVFMKASHPGENIG